MAGGYSSFGVGIEDRTFLAAFTAEEIRAASTVAGEPLKRAARGKVHFLDMVSSAQVEVTRPSEKAGSFFLLTDAAINDSLGGSLRPAA
ncbi:hypothetical protein ACFVXW_15900 [Streptomyces sp. NPDC058251]|uniref:hypothetical protein n=1 Tax=Streptomyces sp. NPDC058251 TaxID=3346404 RepID=UPI0036E32871